MRTRLGDPPEPTAPRAPHSFTANGHRGPARPLFTVPQHPLGGLAFEWLFAKGGMSARVPRSACSERL